MDHRELALRHFDDLGAHLAHREIDRTPVLGIQLRDRIVSDDDLIQLRHLRDVLDEIGLEGTQITEDGLLHLLDLPHLDNVDLARTAIGDAGLRILSRIKTLKYIHVEGTSVTAKGVAALQESLPECEVVWDAE